MITVTYRGITLEMVQIVDLAHEAIYDGPTYLYNKNRLTLNAVYNPQATSYVSGPAQQYGQFGPATEVAIKQELMQPRGTLIVNFGDINVVTAPRAGLLTDAANGPMPISCHVTESSGVKTFIVAYIIEWCQNDCADNSTGPVVLSNRWSATDEFSAPDYLSRRTIRGRAIMRTDRLLGQGLVPDDMRASFFIPIPREFQREHVAVVASEDGSTLEYTIVDQEKVSFPVKNASDSNVTDIQCTHMAQVGRPGVDDVFMPIAGACDWAIGGGRW